MPHSSGGGQHSFGILRVVEGNSRIINIIISIILLISIIMIKNAYYAMCELISGDYNSNMKYDPKSRKIQLVCYIALPSILIPTLFTFLFVKVPHKVNSVAVIYEPTIEDNMNLFTESEEQQLTAYFNKFYKETGITVDIVTTKAFCSYCLNNKDNSKLKVIPIVDYAYNAYEQIAASDETHWLLLFATDVKDPNEWYFEGMQGEATSCIISSRRANRFNTKLYKRICKYGIKNLSRCVTKTFDETTKHWMWPYLEWEYKKD